MSDREEIKRRLDDAYVSISARRTTLELLHAMDLRGYVRTQPNHGVNIVACEKGQTGPLRTREEFRTLFHCFGKELAIATGSVLMIGLTKLVDLLKRDDQELPHHLLISSFFRAGQENPLDGYRLARVIEFIGERHDAGARTHCMIEVESTVEEAGEWYGSRFVDWLQSVNDEVRVRVK